MKKKKITLLDLGGVVFQSTGITNHIINWEVITILNNKYAHGLNIGEDLFPTFMNEYNVMTNQDLSGQEFLKSVFDTLDFNKELIEILSANHKIIIVSDNYKENIEYISQRYHFSNWSDHQVYSYDYKMVKTDPLFFKRLIRELKLEDEDLIFIDDSKEKIDSAARCGIKGILYKNNEQVSQQLSLC